MEFIFYFLMGQFKFNFSGITAIIVFQQVSAKFFYCFKLILFDDVFFIVVALELFWLCVDYLLLCQYFQSYDLKDALKETARFTAALFHAARPPHTITTNFTQLPLLLKESMPNCVLPWCCLIDTDPCLICEDDLLD